MKFTLNKDTVLTSEYIKKFIELHNPEIARLNKLERYYLADNDINKRVMTDINKPNNKIAHGYASYISDTLTGYFLGEPVTYNSDDKDKLAIVNDILTYNDEADENMELAKDMSIFGIAYEMEYLDTDSNIRFKRIDPREVIFIYDDTLEEELLYAIRHYPVVDILHDNNSYERIEVYSKDSITVYKSDTTTSTITLLEEPVNHVFGLVPFIQYKNNEYNLGDYEEVISLIDAYDKLDSDSLNDAEYFTDAYLLLKGVNAESEDIAQMKENRVIILDDNSDATWLTKDLTGSESENLKNRLDKDIHKFSKTPNMSDSEFANNASGIAIKFKTMAMENVVSIKERKFKKGLQRRLELIQNILYIKGIDINYMDFTIVFTRNLPSNMTEIADVISKLATVVSTESLLAQIPFIDDVNAEMERLQEQKEKNPFYDVSVSDYTDTKDTNKDDITE